MHQNQLPASPNPSGAGCPGPEDIRNHKLVKRQRWKEWRRRFDGLFSWLGAGTTEPFIIEWLPEENHDSD